MPTISAELPAGERPVIAVVRAVPGHESQLSAAISSLAAAVRREPGCTEFRAFPDSTAAGVFYLYEIYRDTDAFRTHLSLGHVEQFFTELAVHSTSDAGALVQLVELGSV